MKRTIHTETAAPALLAVALVFFVVGCSGSSAAPSTNSATLHGEANDAVGDVIAGSVATPPDLVHAVADVAAGNITFVIQFAPGTFDRQTTRTSILLDTDQDGSTGIRQVSALGADYSVELVAPTAEATIMKADAVACAASFSCFNAVGSAAITLVQEGMQVTVPLSLVGNDDGRMSFQMFARVLVKLSPSAVASLTAITFDAMPNETAPPARVQ